MPEGGTVTAGGTATFTIVVTNNGPGTATGVAISDPLPAGGGVSLFTAADGIRVNCVAGVQTCGLPIGSLAQSATFTAVVTAATSLGHCTVMNNTATASATNAS